MKDIEFITRIQVNGEKRELTKEEASELILRRVKEPKDLAEMISPSGSRSYRKGTVYLMFYEETKSIKEKVTTTAGKLKDSAVDAFRSMVSNIGTALSGLGTVVENGFQSAINFIVWKPAHNISLFPASFPSVKAGLDISPA